jgi:hypothetical protein
VKERDGGLSAGKVRIDLLLEALPNVGELHRRERPESLAAAKREDKMIDCADAGEGVFDAFRIGGVHHECCEITLQRFLRHVQPRLVAAGYRDPAVEGEKPAGGGETNAGRSTDDSARRDARGDQAPVGVFAAGSDRPAGQPETERPPASLYPE